MAQVEEPQFTTLAERIAALNKQKNFQSPPPAAGRRPPPLPPTRPERRPEPAAGEQEEDAPPLPRRTSTQSQRGPPPSPSPSGRPVAAPPPLPTRRPTDDVSPSLPARRTSTQTLSILPGRRNSNSSDISHVSTLSTLSLTKTPSSTSTGSDKLPPRKLPPTLDEAKLPPLPPLRREIEAKAREAVEKETAAQARSALQSVRSAPIVPRIQEPPRPSLPPRLPSRPTARQPVDEEEAAPVLPARRLPPPPSSYVKSRPGPPGPPGPARDDRGRAGNNGRGRPASPPPVPLATRPTFAQIDAASSRATASGEAACVTCRDYSRPDAVAAQHPASSLPRQDPIGYLAHVLCDPFPALADKARAIFTWCHHNVAYDVAGFFGGCIQRMGPEDTIFAGKAVCEGYARVYETIATRAGLQCELVSGHGKGFGFAPVKPGEPCPPRSATGHAWNAVVLDDGQWKLLDACWGAGHVQGDKSYKKEFSPNMFTMSNDDFGLRHFPADERFFCRSDGRVPSWEEYAMGRCPGEEPVTVYSGAFREGVSDGAVFPAGRRISVSGGGTVRFQIGKLCPHWTSDRCGDGPPYLLTLQIHHASGDQFDVVVLDYDGAWWWADVQARDLGKPGQTIMLCTLETLEGRSARGLTKEQFLRSKGHHTMHRNGVALWELV